jgi:hypothetical protein
VNGFAAVYITFSILTHTNHCVLTWTKWIMRGEIVLVNILINFPSKWNNGTGILSPVSYSNRIGPSNDSLRASSKRKYIRDHHKCHAVQRCSEHRDRELRPDCYQPTLGSKESCTLPWQH